MSKKMPLHPLSNSTTPNCDILSLSLPLGSKDLGVDLDLGLRSHGLGLGGHVVALGLGLGSYGLGLGLGLETQVLGLGLGLDGHGLGLGLDTSGLDSISGNCDKITIYSHKNKTCLHRLTDEELHNKLTSFNENGM